MQAWSSNAYTQKPFKCTKYILIFSIEIVAEQCPDRGPENCPDPEIPATSLREVCGGGLRKKSQIRPRLMLQKAAVETQ
jgi:hypothetical protein